MCTNKLPNVHKSCPFTSTLNLALTVSNFIEHSDVIGWTDDQLMQAILHMLKLNRLDLYVKLIKKNDFIVFFDTLLHNCTMVTEIAQCRE